MRVTPRGLLALSRIVTPVQVTVPAWLKDPDERLLAAWRGIPDTKVGCLEVQSGKAVWVVNNTHRKVLRLRAGAKGDAA